MSKYSPTTRSEAVIVIFISSIPLWIEFAMGHSAWFRGVMVLPIEFLSMGAGVWIGMRVYKLVARDEITGAFDYVALISALMIGLSVAVLFQLLASHQLASAFDAQRYSKPED